METFCDNPFLAPLGPERITQMVKALQTILNRGWMIDEDVEALNEAIHLIQAREDIELSGAKVERDIYAVNRRGPPVRLQLREQWQAMLGGVESIMDLANRTVPLLNGMFKTSSRLMTHVLDGRIIIQSILYLLPEVLEKRHLVAPILSHEKRVPPGLSSSGASEDQATFSQFVDYLLIYANDERMRGEILDGTVSVPQAIEILGEGATFEVIEAKGEIEDIMPHLPQRALQSAAVRLRQGCSSIRSAVAKVTEWVLFCYELSEDGTTVVVKQLPKQELKITTQPTGHRCVDPASLAELLLLLSQWLGPKSQAITTFYEVPGPERAHTPEGQGSCESEGATGSP